MVYNISVKGAREETPVHRRERTLEKIFEKVFKNPLTNTSNCAIIMTVRERKRYNKMTIYSYRHEVPENAMFVRSITGQIYAIDALPEFACGFEIVTRAEYEAYVRNHHLR